MAEALPSILVAAQDVTVRLGRNELLSQVGVEIHEREIVSLIGPNGAGKTTLIRVLLGILKPVRGEVRRRAGLVTGYVPQRFQLDPILPLTVRRFLNMGSRHPEPRLAAVLAEVSADHLLDALMCELSGGEFQRAVLARALLREPSLLILDEPAQGIDFSGQLELYALIDRIHEARGCGVLLVSHDLHFVMAATHRVICLNRHVCCSGKPEAVSQHPDYLGLFGPRAAGLAVYTHTHDHAHDLAGEIVASSDAMAPREGSDAR